MTESPAAEITHNSLDGITGQSGAASWAVEKLSWVEEKSERHLHLKRQSYRLLSQELCASLTQQLAAAILCQLEGRCPPCLLQDAVHGFFRKRYISAEASERGMEEYLCALRRFALDSQVLRLVASVLQLQRPPTILGYVCLLADTLQATPLSTISQCQLFLQQRYHFLEEADCNTLLLEFSSYSQRSSAHHHIMDFLLHLVLQHQDPLITECEEELSTHMRSHAGHLTEEELATALDAMCSITGKTEIEAVIQRTVILTSSSLIPLQAAAQIAAYQLERSKQQSQAQPRPHITGAVDGKKAHDDLRLLQNILALSRNS